MNKAINGNSLQASVKTGLWDKYRSLIAMTTIASSLLVAQGCLPPPEVPPLVSKPATAAQAGLATYWGEPAVPQSYAPLITPTNNFLDPDRSGIHEDTYNSDVSSEAGPLGTNPSVVTHRFNWIAAACPSVLFDSQDRIITVCIMLDAVKLYLLDPYTLKILAEKTLPPKSISLTGENNASGGGYVHMDNLGQVLVGPSDNTIRRYKIAGSAGNLSWVLVENIELDPMLAANTDVSTAGSIAITDTVVDFDGRMWFTSAFGIVGYIDESTTPDSVKVYDFGVDLQNQVAIDPTGVYVVTTDEMNKLVVDSGTGDISLEWHKPYTTGTAGTGLSTGSGTSPTLFGDNDDLVAVTDNDASQLHINIYDRTTGNEICSYPIFEPGKGAAENSPAGYGDEIAISNNYGFPGFFGGNAFDVQAGLVKVKVDRDGGGTPTGCSQVWYQQDIKATPVPFFSTATGLIYTYSLHAGTNGAQGWYLDLVSWDTGLTVNRTWVGNGAEFDNIVQQVAVGSNGAAIVSVRKGLVMVRDN